MRAEDALDGVIHLRSRIDDLMPQLEALTMGDVAHSFRMVEVSRNDIAGVLERAVNGEVAFPELQDWAIELLRLSTTMVSFVVADEGAIRPALFDISEAETDLSHSDLQELLRSLRV